MARTFTATVIGGVALLVTAGAAGLPQLPARADGASAVQPEPSATVTSPARVLLTFDVPTSSDPSDPCNGLYAKNNHVGDHDELTACTFDSNGNPVATDSSGFHLRWEIAGDEANGVTLRFNPDPPPEETSGAAATAHAGIDALAGGRNQVTVTLVDGNGATVDSFSVDKTVGGGCAYSSSDEVVQRHPSTLGSQCPPDVPTRLTARARRSSVTGEVVSEAECEIDRHVSLFRRAPGKDDLIGVDASSERGRWRVETGRLDGRYYARVGRASAVDSESGVTINCLPDQSRDVRGRRRG